MTRIKFVVMSGITIVLLLGLLSSNSQETIKFREKQLSQDALEIIPSEELQIVDYDKEVSEKEVSGYIEVEAEITAYTAGYQCTGKTPDHPQYGVTKSGAMVEEGTSIAAPSVFPFGTVIKVPGYGTGVVQDRGGAVVWSGGRPILDVYIESREDALRWGRRVKEVKIYTDNIPKETIKRIKAKLK